MGNKEGAAKATAAALAKNPDHFKIIGSKGGKSVKAENRPFAKNRKLARLAGKKGGSISRK